MKTTSATEGFWMKDRKYIYIYRGESRLIYLRNDNKGPKVLSHLFFYIQISSLSMLIGVVSLFFIANVVL